VRDAPSLIQLQEKKREARRAKRGRRSDAPREVLAVGRDVHGAGGSLKTQAVNAKRLFYILIFAVASLVAGQRLRDL
jgi:hypothetical protein